MHKNNRPQWIHNKTVEILDFIGDFDDLETAHDTMEIIVNLYMINMTLAMQMGLPYKGFCEIHEQVKTNIIKNCEVNELARLIIKMCGGMKDDNQE